MSELQDALAALDEAASRVRAAVDAERAKVTEVADALVVDAAPAEAPAVDAAGNPIV